MVREVIIKPGKKSRNGDLTRDPIPPAVAPQKSNGINSDTQFCLQAVFSIASVMARVRPMTNPPARDARVPRVDKPPLVPGGTGLNVVIKIGGDLDNIPNSDANVSPKQQAKWLHVIYQSPIRARKPRNAPKRCQEHGPTQP